MCMLLQDVGSLLQINKTTPKQTKTNLCMLLERMRNRKQMQINACAQAYTWQGLVITMPKQLQHMPKINHAKNLALFAFPSGAVSEWASTTNALTDDLVTPCAHWIGGSQRHCTPICLRL